MPLVFNAQSAATALIFILYKETESLPVRDSVLVSHSGFLRLVYSRSPPVQIVAVVLRVQYSPGRLAASTCLAVDCLCLNHRVRSASTQTGSISHPSSQVLEPTVLAPPFPPALPGPGGRLPAPSKRKAPSRLCRASSSAPRRTRDRAPPSVGLARPPRRPRLQDRPGMATGGGLLPTQHAHQLAQALLRPQ